MEMKKIDNSEYLINEKGEVFRPTSKGYVPVKKRISNVGKEVVAIRNLQGERCSYNVDTLLVHAFLGAPLISKTLVRHINGNDKDNSINNLAIASKKDVYGGKRRKKDQLIEKKEKRLESPKNDQYESLKTDYEILKGRFEVVQGVIEKLIKENDYYEKLIDNQKEYSRRLEKLLEKEFITGNVFKKVINLRKSREEADILAKFICETKEVEIVK